MSSLELRRRMMVQSEPADIIIHRKWSDNDGYLMDVIYAQGWSKSKNYMTKREAEAVTSIGSVFNGNTEIQSFNQFEYFIGVSTIAPTAFQKCTSLISIVIPKNVTRIGSEVWSESSFAGCTSLQYVSFAEGSILQFIGGFVFANTNIEYITLPDTVIGVQQTFRNCATLKEIKIPPLETSIGSGAFLGCSSLSTIYFSSSLLSCGSNSFTSPKKDIYFKGTIKDWYINKYVHLRSIGFTLYIFDELDHTYKKPTSVVIEENPSEDYIFNGQTELQEVIIEDDVTTIRDYAFSSCSNLENVTLGNGLTKISNHAFDYCGNLKEVIFPDSIKTIGGADYASGAFRGCTSLTKLEIPDSVELIGSFAFRDCTGIKSVVIGNGHLRIGSMAFGACSLLETIDIGSGIYQLDGDCFWRCNKLKSIIIRALEPPAIDSNAVNDITGVYIYVPDDSVEAYKIADNWSTLASKIKPLSEYA